MHLQQIKNFYHLFQAIIAVIYFRYPAGKLVVTGVTGTDGKTTTATLLYHLLKSAGYKVALISTVAAIIGDEEINTGFHVTTPDSWHLQKLLKKIVDDGYTHLVLEATSHGLDQHRLFGTHITTAIITNITHEHLDYHRTYHQYVKAKAKLFQNAATSIINADDVSYRLLTQLIPKSSRIISYSASQIPPVIKKNFKEKYNQSNALAASLAAEVLLVSAETINQALTTFKGVVGRMQYISNDKKITAIVDFAHTPNALKVALEAARSKTKHKLIVIFGAAGERDQSKRPLMGKMAAELADEVILTTEDPRHEDVRMIIDQIKSGADKNRGHVHSIVDRREAIKFALSIAKAGDTVMICGKGHEASMNLDGKHEIPWSDVYEMKAALDKI